MRTHDMRQPLSLLLLAACLLAGMTWSACIEQTPLNLATTDVCWTPDPGDTVVGETSADVDGADTPTGDTAEDTPQDTGEDTPQDIPQDIPEDTPGDTQDGGDVCLPDCADRPRGADDGCGGFCKGNCDPGWVCVPALGDCMPDSCTDGDGGFVATFPDASLRTAVQEALGAPTTQTEFLWDEVQDLTDLYAGLQEDSSPITDLSGVECLRNLEVLDLADQGLPDTAMAGVMTLSKLTLLELGGNALASFAPFQDALFGGSLVYLKLYSNVSGDVSDLVNLSALEYLSLDDTTVTGADALDGASFQSTLKLLRINGSGISEVPPVGDYPALVVLELAANGLTDLGPFAGNLPIKDALVILHLEENAFQDLTPLDGFFQAAAPQIPEALDGWVQDWRNTLVLNNNDLDTLGPIGAMEYLQVLDVAAAELPNIDAIFEWPTYDALADTGMHLEELDISYNDLNTVLGGFDLQPLQTIWKTLDVLKANGIFDPDKASGLPVQWIPSEAPGTGPWSISVSDNSLTGPNLATFVPSQPTSFAALTTLSLADNAIEGALDSLLDLAIDKSLHTVDLIGNPATLCTDPSLCLLFDALGQLGPWSIDQIDGDLYTEPGPYLDCAVLPLCVTTP